MRLHVAGLIGLVWYAAKCCRPRAVLVLQIESVVHRTRRMILGRIQRVKLWKSSISGHRRLRNRSRQKDSMRSSARVTGCRPPRASARPGSVTSSDSSAKRLAGAASRESLRGSYFRRALMPLNGGLGDVDRSPGGFLLRAAALPRPFRSSVIWPLLPRKRALTCSSASGSEMAAKAALAS